MGADNLLVNGDFAPRSDGGVPSHWETWAPSWENACCEIRSTEDGLVMSSPDEPHGVGGVDQTVSGIREARHTPSRWTSRRPACRNLTDRSSSA
jgi:hypothetical protein